MEEGHANSIAVYPEAFFAGRRRLWEALSAWSGLEIRAWQAGDEERVVAAWMQGPSEALVSSVAGRGGRCLVWPAPGGGDGNGSAVLSYGSSDRVDEGVRGGRFERHEPLVVAPMAAAPGAEVLAQWGDLPLWTREVAGPAGGIVDRLAVEPPELGESRLLRQILKPWRCAALIPLLQCLREAASVDGWEESPRRTCFIFDDPCLCRPTYGYLEFEALAKHAAAHGYHAAVATVPFDSSGVDARVRKHFAGERAPLSLLIHGNNHLRQEVWTDRSEAEWLSMLAQAVRRVERLERDHGLAVARVMEAPHALVSRAAFGPMGRVGFEAALVSPALARVYAAQAGWPVTTGCRSMDDPLEGVSPLPRIPLTSYWREDVALAAFLRQPIIVAGHHQDASDGLGFLEELAARVGRLPGVSWCGLRDLGRSRWQARCRGVEWRLRMGARVVSAPVPAGVSVLRIERPWSGGPGEALRLDGLSDLVAAVEPDGEGRAVVLRQPLDRPVEVCLFSRPVDGIEPESVPAPRPRAWPVMRRFMSVARDRLFPYVPAARRRRPPAYRVP